MNNQLTLLLIISGVFFSYGQDRTLKSGVLLNFEQPIHGAHILNLNSLEGTSSNTDGTFQLLVQLNDTLLISHIKYRKLRVIYTKKFQEQEPMILYLYELTNTLDTITIRNHNLTGNIKVDSESLPKVRNRDSIVTDLQHLAKLSDRKDKVFIADGKTPIYIKSNPYGTPTLKATIWFDYKDLKRKKEFRLKRDFQKKIINHFGFAYFTQTLKIPLDKVHHFISYCEFKNIRELYYGNHLMKLLTILEKESIAYLKIKD